MSPRQPKTQRLVLARDSRAGSLLTPCGVCRLMGALAYFDHVYSQQKLRTRLAVTSRSSGSEAILSAILD
ncbi:hypothetical protein D3C77_401490 [compost metagenome]